jgi:HEAT repeat protein
MSFSTNDDIEAVAETVCLRSRSIAVKDVVTLLETTDKENRTTVTRLLGTVVEQDASRASETVECLVPLLDRPDADLRSEAAAALRHVAAESPPSLDTAINPLVECLEDGSLLVRLNAAAALSMVAETYPTAIGTGVLVLCDCLHSDLPILRVHATSTMQTLAEAVPETVAPASSALLDAVALRSTEVATEADSDGETRPADEELRSAEVEDRLRRLEADTCEVRTTIRWNAAAALVEVVRDDPDVLVGDTSRIIDLAEREPDPTVTASLLTLLGFVAEPHPEEVCPAIDLLVECLQEADDDTLLGKAAWVCSLLTDAAPERVGNELQPALPAIIDALDATPAAQVPAVSLLAYVGEQHPEEVAPARPALRNLLESDYPSARTGAALTLGFVGDDATLPALRTARNDDPRRNVRRAAEKSIHLIDGRHTD